MEAIREQHPLQRVTALLSILRLSLTRSHLGERNH